jgi:hypothetical protein
VICLQEDLLRKIALEEQIEVRQHHTSLALDRNIRHRGVSITGTNYRPLDNEHQIREALNDMCNLINSKENIFEKALLALLLP